jgi:hypothetical protein
MDSVLQMETVRVLHQQSFPDKVRLRNVLFVRLLDALNAQTQQLAQLVERASAFRAKLANALHQILCKAQARLLFVSPVLLQGVSCVRQRQPAQFAALTLTNHKVIAPVILLILLWALIQKLSANFARLMVVFNATTQQPVPPVELTTYCMRMVIAISLGKNRKNKIPKASEVLLLLLFKPLFLSQI